MTSPPDRPAAELLAEWREFTSGAYTPRPSDFHLHEHILERLARAEQALAEIESRHLVDGYSPCGFGSCRCPGPVPCSALRASQGDVS